MRWRSAAISGASVKTLLVAAALFGVVACGDAAAPATTQTAASPTATVTPSAATTPTPAAQAQTVVTFVNAPLMVARGNNATLQVKTAPNTSCAIEVDYKSGASTAAGLVTKTSDGAGNVSWTWKVGSTTTPGSWPITVTCGDGSAQTHITVT
jgi:micrococcal nuclease